jgi:regulator of sigma E protease
MIVLLGLLIFVHELGHFLVAKYYKVRVEVFSLGFGPKIFKVKRGETVYAISAIPLGGYVKMFGDDPTADVGADQKQFAFTHKPVGQRIAIVLAGPLMNLGFAIVLFGCVASLGEQALAPKLGDIDMDTAAYTAGFRSGDTLVSLGGETSTFKTWEEFQRIVDAGAGKLLQVTVERAASGKKEVVQVTPKLNANKNVLSWDREVGEIDGLSYLSRASVVGVNNPESIAGQAGLKTGDIIQSVNGTKITRWRELKDFIENHSGEALALEVERGLLDEKDPSKSSSTESAPLNINIALGAGLKGQPADKTFAALGIEFPELFLANIEKGSPAEAAGLKRGDRVISIDDQPVKSFEQVAIHIRSFGQSVKKSDAKEPTLSMAVIREGKEVRISVAPNMKERMNPMGREERRFEVGIRPLVVDAPAQTIELSYSNPISAFQRGVVQTWNWTSLTVLSFVRLIQMEVSPKNIGGFLSIGKMAKQSWQMGVSQFLRMMAIISINLFVLNLFPVPVLDGGHLVFYSIEALRGAPLSMRKMEIAQQVGLVLLLGLMVFALFNDFSRLLN